MPKPLVSVVVPVYNGEKYLERCVRSIQMQTYRNIELILVDDCSKDTSCLIMERFAREDSRIRLIRHEENRGSFQSRVTGSKVAGGKYIAFVDSDDYISADWIRILVRQAERTGSDITVGPWCFDFEGGQKVFCPRDHFRNHVYCLEGQQITDEFMAVQGLNFSWTILCNKLFQKSLWDRCIPPFQAFSEAHGHMVMWDDIAASAALWFAAKKMTNVHGVLYYYYKHADEATVTCFTEEKKQKYIRDSSAAMEFFAETLRTAGMWERYAQDFRNWKKNGMNLVYRDLVINGQDMHIARKILGAFQGSEHDYEPPNDEYYTDVQPVETAFTSKERLLEAIVRRNAIWILPAYDMADRLLGRGSRGRGFAGRIVSVLIK